MTEHGSFYRKITYLVLIAVLLFPISQLGAPATNEKTGGEGGRLAQLRQQHGLGQANLGEIDPASETIRLATLGMRGVAVSMLWNKANEYKKKEDWTNFRATLNQLAKLQPYFIKFWQYQAWNLTYNVSVELDDVRDRYHYVIRGIEFLKEGIKYNRFSPYLLSELGWFTGNKIGRADEKKEYRRLFKADDDFHPENRPLEQRDNWLVSLGWYRESISAVDDEKKSLGQKNPTTFYANPGRSQINYSEAIETEGTFGEKARAAWATAARLWKEYGGRQLKSTFGFKIRLDDLDRLTKENAEIEKQLEELMSTARDEVLAKKRAALKPAELALVDGPRTGLTDEQTSLLYSLERQLQVEPKDIAEQVAEKHPEKAKQARRLATKYATNDRQIRSIRTNREVVNYEYWETRCALEQSREALKARDLAYTAQKVFKQDANLLEARKLYEESFEQWAAAFEAFPSMPLDSATGSDIMDYVDEYNSVLQQLELSLSDEEVGSKFPLWDLVDQNDQYGKYLEGASKFIRQQKSNPEENQQDSEAETDSAPAAT